MFSNKMMTEWKTRPNPQKTWAHATAYFEAKARAIENFHAAGGPSNMYASANAATEIKDAVAAALDEFATQNKENALAVNEVKEVREKIDTIQEAVALLAKTVTGRKVLTPRKLGRRSRRRQVVEESSDEEESSTEEEDEELTPPPKRKTKKKQLPAKAKAKGKVMAGASSFDVDGPYKPGMKFNSKWSAGKKATYRAARKGYYCTGTKEALTDKVDGMKAMIKR